MKQRIISGLIIGILFIISILFYRNLFNLIIFITAGLMLFEWYKMTNKSTFFCLAGLIIIPFPVSTILFISEIDKIGWFLLTYFSVVWAVDIMAMGGGKLLSGPKLAPVLSPHKTISGLLTGVVSSMFVPWILKILPGYNISYIMPYSTFVICIICGFIGLMAQVSDLFISFFKRKFSVKDSGNIIPGHGGVLDRFDSFILTAPLVLLLIFITN